MASMPSPGCCCCHLFPDDNTAPVWGLGPRPNHLQRTPYPATTAVFLKRKSDGAHSSISSPSKAPCAFQIKPNLLRIACEGCDLTMLIPPASAPGLPLQGQYMEPPWVPKLQHIRYTGFPEAPSNKTLIFSTPTFDTHLGANLTLPSLLSRGTLAALISLNLWVQVLTCYWTMSSWAAKTVFILCLSQGPTQPKSKEEQVSVNTGQMNNKYKISC